MLYLQQIASKINMILSLKKIFLLLNLLFASCLMGQDFTVNGKITDENNEIIEGSEIVLLSENKIISSTISDAQGNFTLKSNSGIYTLRFYFVGSVIYQTDLEIDRNIELGTLKSFDNTNLLGEVEVTSKKKIIESQVDRTVFNVENSIRAAGSDGFELLKATPGVYVSGNLIGIVGKTTASVMVNDRIVNLSGNELVNYLRGISSDNIKSIEVITTPPAKYDAQGNSGLINIRLKKAVQDAWAVNVRNRYMQNSFPSYLGGVSFTYNKNKLSLFTDVIKQVGNDKYWETLNNTFATETWEGRTTQKDKRDVNRLALSLDYKLSENTQIGVNYIGLIYHPGAKSNNITTITDNSTNEITAKLLTKGDNKATTTNHSINTYYVQKLDTLGKQVSVDIDYLKYNDDVNRNFSTRIVDAENNAIANPFIANNTSIQDISNFNGKIDLDLPSKWANYSLGGKLSFVNNSSNIAFFDLSSGEPILDVNQTNDFDFIENTQALYFNFNKKLSEKWQTQIGLRYENTNIETKTISPDATQNQENFIKYDQFFPSIYLSYTPNDNHNFSVNYSKRIGRPDFWNLNPFKLYLNSFTIAEGNPFLLPSFTDNYEINYNFKEKLSFKVYYSGTTNGNTMQFLTIESSSEQTILRYVRDNFFDNYSLGGTITYLFDKFNWWESTLTFNGYNNVTTFIKDVPTEARNGFRYHIYSNNSFVLNKSKSLRAEVNYQFNSARNELYFTGTQYNKLDLGLRYAIKEKGLTLVLDASDIFRSYQADFTSVINNVAQFNNQYYDERRIIIGVLYKFGNKNLSASQRESGNQEIKDRLK